LQSTIERNFWIMDSNFQVLLYYHYVDILDPEEVVLWQIRVCEELGLKGRIRVSPEGINGTLGGPRLVIQQYIESMEAEESIMDGRKIHWKRSGAVDRYPLEEQNFSQLSVKVTKEVVSLDLSEEDRQQMIKVGPGEHLSPQEFHSVISSYLGDTHEQHCGSEHASGDGSRTPGTGDDTGIGTTAIPMGEICNDTSLPPQPGPEYLKVTPLTPTTVPAGGSGRKDLVLIDVRNVYETEIGRFDCSASNGSTSRSIPVLDPGTRKFSEFRKFVDEKASYLADKKVLMYCTGGVRCERASAYMKLRG